MPAIERSRAISASNGSDYWLRFRSPSLGDTVHARVLEPRNAADAPTLVFGHGICVEFDHWRGLIEEAERLRDAGFRVIRPEAPWHGRRTPRGEFGGQRMMTNFPLGLLNGLSAAIREWAVLAHWARETSAGPLAFGGTSLGAQTAQLAADRARSWPGQLRPQGLFLVTHCVRMADATVYGEISGIFGAVHDARAKGWTQEGLEAWLRELDPRSPPVPAERIVTVLGRRDSITPFRSARAVTDDWGIPAANQFLWDRGHFSVPMTLIRDPRPVARFRAVMQGAR
jgi:pimeloyl-ACP methyl ester carboxylesterase